MRLPCVLRPGDGAPLDAFFKSQSIAAHRPPHIPALRMLSDVSIQETSELPAFAARMPRLPAIQTIVESSSGSREVCTHGSCPEHGVCEMFDAELGPLLH